MNSDGLLKKTVLITASVALYACAHGERKAVAYVPAHLYVLNVGYSKDERTFILNLKSLSRRAICISKMAWPDATEGHYLYGDPKVYFLHEGIQYGMKDLASGYCSSPKKDGCIFRLKEGDELQGKIRVTDFSSSPDIYNEPNFSPKLEYPYAPYFCP